MSTVPPDETVTSWGILLLVSLLLLILVVSYVLHTRKIRHVHETVLSTVLGLFVGLMLRVTALKPLAEVVTFDHRFFFNLLLPPIILNSGYDMQKQSFFDNFGVIATFAFVGTFMSTVVIGVLVYLFALTGIHALQISLLDAIIFGAILSSTDPVTVLAMFHELNVEQRLYAIIFGESILNDSVAIVLFGTLGRFRGLDFTMSNLLSGVSSFVGVLLGSVVVGVVLALVLALVLKQHQFFRHPPVETCIVLLVAYSSYLLSNALHLSGIVSLLFCGILLRHYAYDNMSTRSRRTTKYMFRVLSQLCENFVFIYLGITLFTKTDESFYPLLILYTLVLVMAARYIAVIPLSRGINALHRRVHGAVEEYIPRNHQLMIWWAGLRGAISFALASDVHDEAGAPIRTTTLVVCVVSILVLGSTTNTALTRLNIQTGVPIPTDAPSDASDEEDWDDELPGSIGSRRKFVRPFMHLSNVSTPHDPLHERSHDGSMEMGEDTRGLLSVHATAPSVPNWFTKLDDKYFKPIFSRKRRLTSPSSVASTSARSVQLPVDSIPSRSFVLPTSNSSAVTERTSRSNIVALDALRRHSSADRVVSSPRPTEADLARLAGFHSDDNLS